jgi:two-component system KDP operon response regulator KdpE
MLTARSDTDDIVKGLSIGADDYVVKPCKMEELKARLRKVLRGAPTVDEQFDPIYDDGYLHIDSANGTVSRDGDEVHLTPTESHLLNYLVRHRNRIVPHEELLVNVWGPQYTEEVKYLSVYIRYLRQKLERNPSSPDYILTKHRVGYYFNGGSFSS